MSTLSKHHRELTDGVGKCSVPMWCNGMPADFCDRPAYGFRPPGKVYTRPDGVQFRMDFLYAGYVPGLACQAHGGPAAPVCARCKGTKLVTISHGGDGYGDRCAAQADADDQPCPDCQETA
jgi:hypothetical protein